MGAPGLMSLPRYRFKIPSKSICSKGKAFRLLVDCTDAYRMQELQEMTSKKKNKMRIIKPVSILLNPDPPTQNTIKFCQFRKVCLPRPACPDLVGGRWSAANSDQKTIFS